MKEIRLLTIALLLAFTTACSSNPPNVEQSNVEESTRCDAEVATDCTADGAADASDVADRGFDPCLVNAKLPVCNDE